MLGRGVQGNVTRATVMEGVMVHVCKVYVKHAKTSVVVVVVMLV